MSVTVSGADALRHRLAALASDKPDRIILGQFGQLAVQRARELVPKRTGNLARTIRVESVDLHAQRVTVVAGGTQRIGYAAYVEFGTRPHEIVPVRRRALAWGGDRRLSGSLRSGSRPTHFARRVNHPGTRPQPFLERGSRLALSEVGLSDAIVRVWNEAA